VNSHHEAVSYKLPDSPLGHGWELMVNTACLEQPFRRNKAPGNLEVAPRSLMLLCEPQSGGARQRPK
jgi:hypothetical protein